MLELLGTGGLAQSLRDAMPVIVALAAALSVMVLLSRLLTGGTRKTGGSGLASRIGRALGAAFTTNWQLTLLATTALVLSLASGWTTWDGMRNFTGEPLLSLMVTFGIQGVMLIIAWLIGESFASGMRRSDPHRRAELTFGSVVGALAFIGLAAMLLKSIGAFDGMLAAQSGSWLQFADKALFVGVALLIVVALMLNQRSSIIEPYLQSVQVMAKNAVLWVMFLSCMATSVFFSFDSLFSSIFPQDERRRAADIRAARQVAGVVNDIGALATRRQAEEAEHLFKNPGWAAYEKQLADLSRASQGAEEAIERYFVERMEAHKSAMAAQQERIATAKSGQAGLTSRKGVLTDELGRLKGERPTLAAELAEKKTELDNRAKGLDAKRVEMMAEEKGAEGTLKVGQGPVFRQRKGELQQLQDAFKIQEERVRDAQKRLQTVDTRVAQLEREIAAIDGDMAKLKGEAETAAQRIAVAEQTKSGDADTPKVDPARVRAAFERAHADFRQEPTVERLNVLATQCTQLLTAMVSTPATKDRVRAIDCDPKQATEAAARVFALNTGLVTFAQNCVGGSKLPTGGTDQLLNFGRKCLQDSGLPSNDSADMAAKISSIDLNRDDKAHRFVVTWNAFGDGNRLAYLALAIAIAIDSLVFMSGLFGANAVRSPLTAIGMRDPMSADELGAIIDGALHNTPHPRETLQAILGSLHTIADREGFTAEISLDEVDAGIVREVRQVLTAAGTIEAVRPIGSDKIRYQLHYGLIRYLGIALKKAPQIHREQLDRKELVNVVGVALLPDPQRNADIVLAEMHPISDAQGFAAETSPFKITDQATKRLVINTLGAGATVPGAVKRNNEDGRYFVSTDFYKTLLLMRAAAIPAFAPEAVQRRFGSAGAGGALQAGPVQSLEALQVRQIEDQASRPRGTPQGGESQSPPRQSAPGPQSRPASVPGVMPAASPPAAPPPLPVAAAPAPQQPAPRKPQSSRLASEIRADIIARGLHPWSDQEIEAAWHTHADRRLHKALAELVARSAKLGEHVDAAMQEYQELVQEAFQDLRDEHAGDPNYVQVLESEVQKLNRLMPVLVMTPAGPYEQVVEKMIRDLRTRGGILEDQAGNGRLSTDEMSLLKGLEKHLYQLRQLPGNSFDRNERLAQILDTYREGVSADVWTGGGDAPPVT